MQYLSCSAADTKNFAKLFSAGFIGGETIGLVGNLGAGKTVLAQGLAAGLGVKQVVNSPTFVLMKVYRIKNHATVKHLVHVDAYRLKSPKDMQAIGLNDYFDQPDTVVVIEWADKIKKILPKSTIVIKLENKGDDQRLIKY